MTKEDVLKALEEFRKKNLQRIPSSNYSTAEGLYRQSELKEDAKGNISNGFISEAWTTGGMTGGSCWGTERYSVEPEDEKDLDLLFQFLEEYFPAISFLDANKLLKQVKKGTYDYSGYYGNYSNYAFKYVLFDDIVALLGED